MKLKSLFVSHGGGPLPLLADAGHAEMVSALKMISSRITKPDAIVLISAHWEEKIPTITSGPSPALIYDYYGFPEETYSIEYPCPGDPALAHEIHGVLKKANIESILDNKRGFDHGMFVPMKIMYPDASIPCIQLSLTKSLDPVEHLNIGAALQQISSDQNILVIGSGFSFHNMNAFFSTNTATSESYNLSFESWLKDTFCNKDLSEDERKERLVNWQKAPGARFCHPREEHLMPLHVCYGVAQSPCLEYLDVNIFGKRASMILF